ncbi:ribosome maturation factor RimP [Oligoflexaceae bacterium]|nr:ribosome maturation factor RimP [Oligoflexaceae bacterium]
MNRSQLDEIIEFVNAPTATLGLECIEVEWVEKERILRLFIDGPDGVDIDDCAKVSKSLEEVSAIDEIIEGAFHLEVSSPGIERPLRTLSHFQDHLEKEVEVILTERVDERKHGTGKVVEVNADEKKVSLETSRGVWVFPIEKLSSCRLKFDWKSK